MDAFATEFEFELPKGYVDKEGTLHKKGTMRLATAADEILPMKDPRVQQNPSYLSVILISRVLARLGTMDVINTSVVENLFSSDFNYLQEMYNRINQNGSNTLEVTCPKCENQFSAEVTGLGEG